MPWYTPKMPATKTSTPVVPRPVASEDNETQVADMGQQKGQQFASVGSTGAEIKKRRSYLDSIE